MKKQFWILLPSILVIAAGCSIFRSDDQDRNETARTYPEALHLEVTTVHYLKEQVEPPDSLNVDAYVINIIACPPKSYCILPDGIIISDSLNPQTSESQLLLRVNHPKQFIRDQVYRLSLQIGAAPGNSEKRFELLGYSRLLLYD